MTPSLRRSVWIHAVLITRHQTPWITPELRPELYACISEFAEEQHVLLDCIHGTANHIHLLFQQPAHQLLGDWMIRLKGKTTRWMREHFPEFKWEADYAAISVSEERVPALRKRLIHQSAQHPHITLKRELWELNLLASSPQCVIIGSVNAPVPGPDQVWRHLLAG